MVFYTTDSKLQRTQLELTEVNWFMNMFLLCFMYISFCNQSLQCIVKITRK